jgi:hypothetical protein
MTSLEKNLAWIKAFFIVGMVFLSACKSHVMVNETSELPTDIEKILLLPFSDMPAVYGENVNIRCPLSGNVYMTGKVAKGSVDMLTDHLVDLLKDSKDFKLIPPSQAEGVLPGFMSKDNIRLSELQLLIETGRALGADAVIVGHVYRFKERVGNKYSVDSPASVTFDLHLIHMDSGRLIWSGHFHETQRSLSEDLFQIGTFLRRKGKWITAKEMATSGLEDLIETRLVR